MSIEPRYSYAGCSGPTDCDKCLQCTHGTLASTYLDIDLHLRDSIHSFSAAVLAGICVGEGLDSLMEEMLNREKLHARLKSAGQDHLLRFWDQIDDAGRRQLAAQIGATDLGQIERLYKQGASGQDWAALARRATP